MGGRALDPRTGRGGASPNGAPVAEASDFALVIYTSGTTGKPKGVLLDHANLEAMSTSIIEHFTLTDDRHEPPRPSPVPRQRAGRSASSRSFAPAATSWSHRASRPDTFWDLVETHRPTYFSAVPTIYAVLDAEADREVDTSSLRFVICGAAPMPAELITRFEDRFKVPVVEGYGLSEGSVASTINPVAGPRKPGTVGVALPGQEVLVVDSLTVNASPRDNAGRWSSAAPT